MEIDWFTEGEQEDIAPGLDENGETEYVVESDVSEMKQSDLVSDIDLYQEPQYLTEQEVKESKQITLSYAFEQVTLDEWSNMYQKLSD